MADVVDIPEFRAFYYTDDTPRQFYTLRRYEDESGSGKMHCYNIAPGIQLSFNDLNLSSCYQPLNVQKDFLEIKEGENALGGTKVDNIKTIELRNVSFDYPQCKMALSTINLKIKSNEQIAIVGKNGSGKSTLFKILCGLYKPTSG